MLNHDSIIEPLPMKNIFNVASFLLVLCMIAPASFAQTVKKWVDEDGVTHYSDQQPVESESEVKEIEVPEANVSEFESDAATQRIQSQLEQMEQDRKAREAEAREKETAKALEESMEREPLVVEEKKKKKKSGRPRTNPYPVEIPTLPRIPDPRDQQQTQ